MDVKQKLELHYYFSDDTHSMNAVIRNECEKELLALFKECSVLFGINFDIESEAFSEGGLKEVWDFCGTPQVAVFLVILSIVLSRFPPVNESKEKAEEQLIELQTEETKLNIKLIQQKLKTLDQGNPDISQASEVAEEIVKSAKVIVRRSNFYEKLLKSKKVEALSFSAIDSENKLISEPQNVQRDSFEKFIIHSKILKPLITKGAEIEIIAPVLKEGNYKWKGLLNNEPISFTMKDSRFRFQVCSKEVSFQNGSTIICVLETERKLDETGEILISSGFIPRRLRRKVGKTIG